MCKLKKHDETFEIVKIMYFDEIIDEILKIIDILCAIFEEYIAHLTQHLLIS